MGRTGEELGTGEGSEGRIEGNSHVKKWMRTRRYSHKFHINDKIIILTRKTGTEKSSAVASTTVNGHAGRKDDWAFCLHNFRSLRHRNARVMTMRKRKDDNKTKAKKFF